MINNTHPCYTRIFLLMLLVFTVMLALLIASWQAAYVPPDESAASSTINIGILGDSGTDEYRGDDNRGGAYANVTFNWLELFVRTRGANAGPWGTRPAPRRQGYEYNWARSGAVADDLSAQAPGLAQQVKDGKVNFVVVWIGANDFADYKGSYAPIYNGSLSGAGLTKKINDYMSDVRNAVSSVMAAGDPMLTIVSITDWSIHPDIVRKYPDASKRQRVTNTVNQINSQLRTLAEEYDGLYIHSDDYAGEFLASINPATQTISLEGETLFFRSGDDPHNILLGDGIHAGTVAEGMILKFFIPHFNSKWGLNIPEISNYELLANAGIKPPLNKCKSDINEDGITDLQDYGYLVIDFLKTSPSRPRSDINGNGIVDIDDYSLLVGNFFKTSCT